MRYILLIVTIMLSATALLGQNAIEDTGYREQECGTIATERNYPYYYLRTPSDSILIQCRRLTRKPCIFLESNQLQNISNIKNKPFDALTDEEKEKIIINAWHTKDHNLLSIVNQIANTDSDTTEELRYLRKLSIMCLSNFNTKSTKEILHKLEKNDEREISILSSLALIQLGETNNTEFSNIVKWYKTYPNKVQTISALMIINTPSAINILKKMAEDKDPSYALDASAALSLLGHCDFAFHKIIEFRDSNNTFVRQMVAWCLAYYIGTPEAIKIIQTINDDPEHLLSQEREKIFKLYKLNL